jgi:hypothetical protein
MADPPPTPDVPGITWGDDDSIGAHLRTCPPHSMLRIALQERWLRVDDRLLRIQVIDGVVHWDYFDDEKRPEGSGS